MSVSAGHFDTDTTPDLEAVRVTASRFFVFLLWVYAAANVIVAYAAGNSVVFAAAASALVAGIGTALWSQAPTAPMTRYTIAAAMASEWMVLIYAASNTPGGFILEAHMMFFVIICQLLAYFCWRTILLVSAIPAIHHLVLTFVYPLFVWPTLDYRLLHLGNHVILVVLATIPALWLAWRVHGLFLASHGALQEVQDANQHRDRLERETAARTREAETAKQRTLQQLASSFEASVKGLVSGLQSAVDRLKANAEELNRGSDQAQQQSGEMAGAAERASQSVETVAAAAEQLTASINEISHRVTDSARIAQTAVEEANRTNATVAGLSDAAQKIGEVVGLINNIASQTNLLALNATIEAARAGEAGKGFAVVASEVKNLANQTAKATEDIQAQVAQMQSVTGSAVDAIRSITGTIVQMNEIAGTIAAAVEEQSAATREITRNVHQASDSTREVSRTIATVAQVATETGRTANETLSATNGLAQLSRDLGREVDGFVLRVRNS
jgi:methyl-accepting chemotaxis protein